MACFVIIVNGVQPLTISTKHSILYVAAALNPPLHLMVWHSNNHPGILSRAIVTRITFLINSILNNLTIQCLHFDILNNNKLGVVALKRQQLLNAANFFMRHRRGILNFKVSSSRCFIVDHCWLWSFLELLKEARTITCPVL